MTRKFKSVSDVLNKKQTNKEIDTNALGFEKHLKPIGFRSGSVIMFVNNLSSIETT